MFSQMLQFKTLLGLYFLILKNYEVVVDINKMLFIPFIFIQYRIQYVHEPYWIKQQSQIMYCFKVKYIQTLTEKTKVYSKNDHAFFYKTLF